MLELRQEGHLRHDCKAPKKAKKREERGYQNKDMKKKRQQKQAVKWERENMTNISYASAIGSLIYFMVCKKLPCSESVKSLHGKSRQ